MTGPDDADDPEFPDSVRAAGLIWLGFGGFGVLGGLAVLVAIAAGAFSFSAFLLAFVLFPASLGAVRHGYRVARGAMSDDDVLVAGFRSLAGGAGLLILGLVVLGVLGPLLGPGHWKIIVAGGSSLGLGVLLVVAGSLAVNGRSRYEAWWRAHHPPDRADDPGG